MKLTGGNDGLCGGQDDEGQSQPRQHQSMAKWIEYSGMSYGGGPSPNPT